MGRLTVVIVLMVIPALLWAKEIKLSSPGNTNHVVIICDSTLRFSVWRQNDLLFTTGPVQLDMVGLDILGVKPIIRKTTIIKKNETLKVLVPTKFRTIQDMYNELTITFKGGYQLVFRAYDNGVAYRLVTSVKTDSVKVSGENLSFQINNPGQAIWPYEGTKHANPFLSHFEYLFKETSLSDIDSAIVGLPLYFTAGNDLRIVFTESDLFDYPNLFIRKEGNDFKAVFPHIIAEQERVGDRGIRILKESDYIAVTGGERAYPWRVWTIDNNDAELLVNTLVYQLATPSVLPETNWIKPGKVAWDWFNALNLYNVDFKAGINNTTYKYYIDFAARFGLEYIILDEGWSRNTLDLMHPNPDIDVPELVRYGKERNVGVILWTLWNPLDENMDAILDLFASWGVKGIKVDFMARAEQYMVNFYTRTAEACAKRKLLVDFHGAYKPTGLERTYPNILSFEGVHGLENNKWEETITPGHDVTIPFTRMLAGPMDYTPGAMHNAVKGNSYPMFTQPMSMGTRAHQTALYVIYESPLQMLADSPSNYYQDEEYTVYISGIPVVWDDTKVLYAKAGKALLIARKNGDNWYIGGATDWDSFSEKVALRFLDDKKYEASILSDGMNADRVGSDYKIEKRVVDAGTVLDVKMASGGGFVVVLRPLAD